MDEPALPDPGTGPAVREATRGPSASAVLFTVLGEFFREPDDGAWTGTLLGALGELGFGEAAARRALTRAASAGWVTSRRHGRTIQGPGIPGRQTVGVSAVIPGGTPGCPHAIAGSSWMRWLQVRVRHQLG